MCQHFSFVYLIHSEALSRFCFSIVVEISSLHLQGVAAFPSKPTLAQGFCLLMPALPGGCGQRTDVVLLLGRRPRRESGWYTRVELLTMLCTKSRQSDTHHEFCIVTGRYHSNFSIFFNKVSNLALSLFSQKNVDHLSITLCCIIAAFSVELSKIVGFSPFEN